MRKRTKFAAVVAGAALTFSNTACGQEAQAPKDPGLFFPPDVKVSIERARDQAIAFWRARGIGDIGVDNFVFLEGTATLPNSCKDSEVIDGKEQEPPKDLTSRINISPIYCPTSDKVVVNPASVQWGLPEKYANDPAAAAVLGAIIVRHEADHLAQERKGISDTLSSLGEEKHADCYAGVLTALNSPGDLAYARDIMEYVANQTYPEAKAVFERGLSDTFGRGQVCELLPAAGK